MESTSKKVCVIGNNTADLVFVGDTNPEIGGKVTAREMRVLGGGQAANTAFTLAALGLRVRYLGCFGDDGYGSISRGSLTQEGVDTGDCPTISNCPNHLACVWVSTHNKDRTILMHKDPRLAADRLEPEQRWIEGCHALYTDGHEPLLSTRMAIMARSLGIPVVADAEKVTDEIFELLKHTSTLIAPLRIMLEIAKKVDRIEALTEVRRIGPSTVVATMGSSGSACLSEEGYMEVSAAACEPVDTTGAGDAFHAGFIAAILDGRKSMRGVLAFASRIASLKCESSGPRLSDTSLAQARDQMKTFTQETV